MDPTYQVVLGGGCFWGVQRDLEQLPGIIETEAGYAGGHTEDPTYPEVCSGTTGHAEVVRVVADPTKLPFKALIQSFLGLHDPTQGMRQGPDVGAQYRSVIIVPDEALARQATHLLQEAQRDYSKTLTTEVLVGARFFPAEQKHQHYFGRCGR
jgi:peptide-methionine (S)-S-oxide reductase